MSTCRNAPSNCLRPGRLIQSHGCPTSYPLRRDHQRAGSLPDLQKETGIAKSAGANQTPGLWIPARSQSLIGGKVKLPLPLGLGVIDLTIDYHLYAEALIVMVALNQSQTGVPGGLLIHILFLRAVDAWAEGDAVAAGGAVKYPRSDAQGRGCRCGYIPVKPIWLWLRAGA